MGEMKDAWRRHVADAVVLLLFVAGITLLSSAALAVLWLALIWAGHYAAMVLPVWLVTTARYAVWAFALMGMATAAILVFFIFHQDAVVWAYAAVGIQKPGNALARRPSDGGNDPPVRV